MPAEPIQYWHRTKKAVETEKIYRERWLRFVYENPAGRLALWLVVRRVFFTQYYAWRMNRTFSANLILPFIVDHDIDVDDFAKSAFSYKTFNEFFFRALKPSARPIAPDSIRSVGSTPSTRSGQASSPQAGSGSLTPQAGDRVAILPADGRHLVFPDVDAADGFYVKGAKFTLAELLGDAALAEQFAGGAMLISRLAPPDYHRFHFPVDGTPGEPRRIDGWLYSVHPIALRRNLRYLVENRREVTLIESPSFGRVAMIEIGATCVGRIMQTYLAGRAVRKGDEKGMFSFGGSCIVTLFARGRIKFDTDLIEQSRSRRETYARMGERVGAAA